jgi:hypothetical protein
LQTCTVIVSELGDHAVQGVGEVNAALGCVFGTCGGDGDSCDGFIQGQASEQAVAEFSVSDFSQGLLAFVQVLHGQWISPSPS